jgi:hypothetical protein
LVAAECSNSREAPSAGLALKVANLRQRTDRWVRDPILREQRKLIAAESQGLSRVRLP